jgi:branched-chain amino acid transport system substrate-binding protein
VARIPVAAVPDARAASPDGIAVGEAAVWVTNALAGTVARIDPALNAVTRTVKVGRRPTQVAVGAGAVWVLNAGDGTVSRIDPSRDAVVATIPVGANVTGIAAGLGGVWVSVAGGRPRERRAPRVAAVAGLSSPRCAATSHGAGAPDLLIASELPSYGADPTLARTVADMRSAIRLVLEQRGYRAGPYRVGYQTCNDARPGEGSDPDLCASNARAFALNPALVGVIGAYNSFCSGIQLPGLNSAVAGPVAMVSPTNTYIGLTRSGPATAADEPDRYYPTGARNFVHLMASDDYQAAGIDLFLSQLHRHRLFLLDDGEATGYAGAIFARRFATSARLTIAGSAEWSAAARGYLGLAARIARARADAVVLSGCICSNGAALVRDLRRVLGRRVTLIATDNFIHSTEFVRTRTFDGMYMSVASKPPGALGDRGRAFLRKLAPERRPDDIDPAVAYAAQATTVLLDAIGRSKGTRPSVVRQLLKTQLHTGITGPVRFTSEGDPASAPIAIYRVDSRAAPAPHRTVQGLVVVRVVDVRPAAVTGARP